MRLIGSLFNPIGYSYNLKIIEINSYKSDSLCLLMKFLQILIKKNCMNWCFFSISPSNITGHDELKFSKQKKLITYLDEILIER